MMSIHISFAALKKFITALLFSFGLFALTQSAAAQTPATFAINKNLCTGVPTLSGNSENCATAQTVPANSPVYYVISLSNPFGVAAQTVALADAYPAGFVPTPAPNGMFCKDGAGAPVAISPNAAPNGIGTVALPANNSNVYCFIPGSFSTTGLKTNTAVGSSPGSSPTQASVNTNVLQALPLPTDLEVKKTAAPLAGIDISSGPAFITYTITITNKGSTTASVYDYFKLYDNLSLPPNGVPLNVSYVSASCASTPGTSCLDPAGPTLAGPAPTFVPSSSPRPFFDWTFEKPGNILPGGVITLTVVVKVEQLTGLSCVAQLNANGLVNTVFFTLTDAASGTALNDINSANNTDSVKTPVNTGQTDVIEGCGKGHLLVKKIPIAPLNPTPWGNQVRYRITIKNLSVPNQPITIHKAQFEDMVTEGINTPPFTRRHINTACISSSPGPNICAAFNPGISPDPDFKYSFYGQAQRAWLSNKAFTVAFGQEVTFETTFVYEKPDCENVPAAKDKPILNTAVVRYQATAYGAAIGSPQNVSFVVGSTAETKMAENKPCAFEVSKQLRGLPKQLQFGVPLTYYVTFINNGAPRTIGTLLDAVRITKGNYATSLPFNSSWHCSPKNGVTGFTASGSITSGAAVYNGSAVQGAPAANLGINVFFPTSGALICEIKITVNRPAFNDPYCTRDPVEFENMALMDITTPFNNNIAWPPSATYNPVLPWNPQPQKTSWATAKLLLPACWDAMINKTSSVAGFPAGSAPWTFVGGPAIDYTIATTNLAQSPLGTTATSPGWSVIDTFAAPYNNTNAVAAATPCPSPSGWCHTTSPHDPKQQLGIKNLSPNQTGFWNLSYPGAFTVNQPITNCAKVVATGVYAGPDYYQNSNPANPIESCKTVPVIAVTKISTTKVLVDQTGANVKVGGPYNVSISCSPFALQTSQTNFTLTTGMSGQSLANVTNNVPVNSTCTVAETSNPIPSAAAAACGGESYVATNTTISPLPGTLNATNNDITITNTLSCIRGSIEVQKQIIGIVGVPVPTQAYTINANCNLGATPASVEINSGVGSGGSFGTATFIAPLGVSCVLTEKSPAVPASLTQFCASLGKGPAEWLAPVFMPSSNITASNPKTLVTVQNEWKCGPAIPLGTSLINITKLITVPHANPIAMPTLPYEIAANCSPNAMPTNVTITTNGIANNTASMAVPTNAICAFSEVLPPIPLAYATHGCAGVTPAQMLVWDTPLFSPTQPMPITGNAENLTITNRMKCVPIPPTSTTYVKKIVTGPAGLTLPPIAFQISANCVPAGISSGKVSIGAASGLLGMSLQVGAVCNFSEELPVFPSTSVAAAAALCPQGTLTWSPPVFSPAGPLTITSLSQTMTVTNNWMCVPNSPAPGVIQVIKEVTGSGTVAGSLSPMAFDIDSTCGNLTIAAPTGNGTYPGSSVSALIGTNCQFTERQPQFLYADNDRLCAHPILYGLMWDAPIYSPTSSLSVSGIVQTIKVTNNWKCVPAQRISIVKTVVGPATVSAMPFGINSNCGNVTITTNGTSPQNANFVIAPLGTVCSFSETLPTFNSDAIAACTNGNVPKWSAPVFSAQSLTVNAVGAQYLTVTNTWSCVCPTCRAATHSPTVQDKSNLTIVNRVAGPRLASFFEPFTVTANCLMSVSPSIKVPADGRGVLRVPVGASCRLGQTQPAFPLSVSSACANEFGQGAQPKWDAPIFSAGQPMRIGVNELFVTVINNWRCVKTNTPSLPRMVTGSSTPVSPTQQPAQAGALPLNPGQLPLLMPGTLQMPLRP